MRFNKTSLQFALFACIAICSIQCNSSTAGANDQKRSTAIFQCLPCGQDCDKEVYAQGGICPHCKMKLVDQSTIVFKTLPISEICKYLAAHPEVVLLDVRTKEEFEQKADPNYGTLKNAINIPIQELESKISSIDSYKDKEVLVYCSHSHRSPQASYILTQNGFKNVTNVGGGISLLTDTSCKK